MYSDTMLMVAMRTRLTVPSRGKGEIYRREHAETQCVREVKAHREIEKERER